MKPVDEELEDSWRNADLRCVLEGHRRMVGIRTAIGRKHSQVWREDCQHQHHFSSDLFRDRLSIWLRVSQLFPEGHLLADFTLDQTDNQQACGNFVLAASGCHPQERHTSYPERGQLLIHLETGRFLNHHPHSHSLLCLIWDHTCALNEKYPLQTCEFEPLLLS